MSTALSEKQFDAVVSAILDGKYSWACVLVLEAAGHNPLDYIPRRTYTRLKRECCQHAQSEAYPVHASSPPPLYQLSQVDFLEPCSQEKWGGSRQIAWPSSKRLRSCLAQARQLLLSNLG